MMARVLTIAVAAAALLASEAEARPPIWRVRDGDTTIVLFGSMHALPKDTEWRTPEFDAAVARAQELWFEFPSPVAAGIADAYAKAYAALPKPAAKTSELLSPEGRDLAVAAFGSLAAVDAWPPSALLTELSRRYWAKVGAAVKYGVETYVQAKAPPERQHAFGSPAEHLALGAGAPLERQIAELEAYLRAPNDPEPMRKSMEAWLSGDVDALEREAGQRMRDASPGAYDRIVTQRNRAWAGQIEAMLGRPGEMVVIVGAGHMTGPDGLPALLRAHGLTVEGP